MIIPVGIGRIRGTTGSAELEPVCWQFCLVLLWRSDMTKLLSVLIAASFTFCIGGAYADDMKKDDMAKDSTSKDSMSKDSMSKDGMKKEGMKHDKMMKKDDMAKDGMKKD